MRWYKQSSRVIKRFAWFPITIGDETRWLETVYLRQNHASLEPIFPWYNIRFTDGKEYLEYKKECRDALL